MKMFVLSLLMVVCNQLETTAQDDNVTSVNTPPPNTTSIMDVTSDNSETESNDFMISIEAIIGIAAGGITVVVVVTLVFVYCCYRYWKHHQKKGCTVPQTTIQIMPDGYVPHSRHSSVRASQIAHNLQASMILLRYAFKHKEKELPEIVTPV